MDDILKIADREFKSRFMIGTGKFPSDEIMNKCLDASEAEIITVAVRRVDLENPNADIMSALDPKKIFILPNTSGAQNADEAVRTAMLARGMGLSNWIKLEVTPDPKYLWPDGDETLKAARILVKEGFVVLPYIGPDPVLAKKLEDAGTATVMPLASPIGTNKGMKSIDTIKIIIEQAGIPVVIDAGIGSPSDAALAMELGADAVMINTAISASPDPVRMAEAFKLAARAGRLAYLAGMAEKRDNARPSSPTDWLVK
ncbi:MAG: thiazole synthase [Candidatus Goldiibacteriota bacterium HGW-Goldbacteria-1]|jgi:thiazole synthase|nr:MAG: thiazole synthase [Candidatus Goldiibacteriota bacterium HGW-Goldbacteria-1]